MATLKITLTNDAVDRDIKVMTSDRDLKILMDLWLNSGDCAIKVAAVKEV